MNIFNRGKPISKSVIRAPLDIKISKAPLDIKISKVNHN